MEIWISNEQAKVTVTEEQEEMVRKVAERALKLAGSGLGLGENIEVSITFVDDEAITDLNRDHRGLARATDVLSFSQLEGEEMGDPPEGEPLPIGDIVISLERCLTQAADYGHSLERELGFLTAHGMLHLMGYDHQSPEDEAAMMAKTEEILTELGLIR